MLTPLGFSLLRQLADGEFHSGEDLAAKVGLTRARVSQVLKDAGTAGLALERVKGRGYRLLEAPEFLDAKKVRAQLDDLLGGEGRRVPRHPSRSSTRSSRRPPSSCAGRSAATFTASRSPRNGRSAGRGRRGRAWTAIAGGSLTFSLGWKFEQGAGFLAGLSLAVGVAVVRALEAEGFKDVALKWPNDLIHRHLKVGGILIELNGDALGPDDDGHRRRAQRPDSRRPPARTSRCRSPISPPSPGAGRLRSIATGCSRRSLAELAAVLELYANEGFAPFAAEWQHRHAYQGKPVRLLLPDGATVTGKVAGVDASGALVLADGPRRARFLSGEITLRRA